MSGRIVQYRDTTLEISIFNKDENQWYHLARFFRHALHSTKGWRFVTTHKILTKIHQKYSITSIRKREKFERVGKVKDRTLARLQVRP